MTETKVVNLYKGAQDGLVLYTNEELSEGEIFWVPSPQLREMLSEHSIESIRDILSDPENERYLDYDCCLIAYVMEAELEWEDGYLSYLYGECPEETYARIDAREHYNQEHQ